MKKGEKRKKIRKKESQGNGVNVLTCASRGKQPLSGRGDLSGVLGKKKGSAKERKKVPRGLLCREVAHPRKTLPWKEGK